MVWKQMRFTRQESDWYCPKLIVWTPETHTKRIPQVLQTYQERTNPGPENGALKEVFLGARIWNHFLLSVL